MKTVGMLGWLAAAVYFKSGPLFFSFAVVLVVVVATRFWLRDTGGHLMVSRALEPRLFFGQRTTVRIVVQNGSVFSIPWLEVAESMPVGLRIADRTQRVLSVAAGRREEITYDLVGRKRGLYSVGPLALSLGDVFGVARRDLVLPRLQFVLVYPRMLALHELDLPAVALFGDLRSRRPILGDPARVSGVRDYRAGDPLHEIHWRATAATGTLQVKLFDPATTVQTMIYADLDRSGYPDANPFVSMELAISIAATVARRLTDTRQAVGLATNGRLTPVPGWLDDGRSGLFERSRAAPVPETSGFEKGTSVVAPVLLPAKGQARLTHILETLARLEAAEDLPVLRDLHARHLSLPWGSTLVLITGFVDDELLVVLRRFHEAGLLVVILVAGQRGVDPALVARARSLGLHVRGVWADASYLAAPA